MSGDPYSPRVRALFAEPAHAGDVEGGVQVLVDDQGLQIALSAACEDGVLRSLRFRARGCPHFIAAAEAFCADFEGRPCIELVEFRAAGLMKTLPVPTRKMGRILVLEDAVRSLGQGVRTITETDKPNGNLAD